MFTLFKCVFFRVSVLLICLVCHTASAAAQETGSGTEDILDLTGIWIVSNRSLRGSRDEDFNTLPPEDYLNERGLAAIAAVRPAFDPSVLCLPSMPRHFGAPYPFEIIQNENRLVQLFQYDNVFRIIYTDGRDHPDPVEDQRFLGHAVGHWDSGTFIVDTKNFNGKTWLAANGLPVSENAHLTEWYSLIDSGQTLQLILRYEDEEYLLRPVWTKYLFNLKEDWDIQEYFCAEGNRDNIFNQQNQPGALNAEDILGD